MNLEIRLLIFLLFIFNTVYSQVALNFVEKDVIDLPGNNILDLKIQDINNDSFPDYIYRDQDSVYIVDGISRNEIFAVSQIPYFRTFAVGDINSDNMADLFLAGYYSDNIDTNYIIMIAGPDYANEYTYNYVVPVGDRRVHPVDLYIHSLFGQDLLFVGNERIRSGGNSYYYWSESRGTMLILEFQDNQFNLLHNFFLSGRAENFLYCNDSSGELIVFTALGQDFEANPDQNYFLWDNWTDIFIMDNFYRYSIWYTTGNSDYYYNLGHVRNLMIKQPQTGDFHIYYFNFTDAEPHESLVCREVPFVSGHNWQIQGDYQSYAGKKMAVTDVTGDGQVDVLIFNPVEIRDAFTGDLINSGWATGQRGLYVTNFDQENDGVDEFFFRSSDSLYVFNLQIPTSIVSESINVPSEISISGNYPNPFNLRTSFEITVEEQSNLKIEIFDILGRKVLPDQERLLKAGKHNIGLDFGAMKSGIYFVRFVSGEYFTIKKVSLIK